MPLSSSPPLLPATARYLATATWENYADGELQATTIARTLHVRLHPLAQGAVLTLETALPIVQAGAELPLAGLARQLAALYARLELQVAADGQMVALLNYPALRQAGDQLLAGLQAAADPADQVTATLLAFAGRQLASPGAVLQSLQFDYLYQSLLAGLALPLPGTVRPARQFAGFFDKTALWFAEQADAEPAAGAFFRWRLHGSLDAARTDLAAVQTQQTRAARLAAPDRLPAELPAPHFCYEAVYSHEPAGSLPLALDLTVYARAGERLNKEYHLTLERA